MAPTPPTVLQYTGAVHDRGGIMSVLGALAAAPEFASCWGVSPGFTAVRFAHVPTLTLPAIAAESIGPRTWWQAARVAREVRAWLAADPTRVFHGHSRAGLLVALRLAAQRRVVASVHCYGRQRWFYRHAARRLGGRLYWLTPAMKRHYGLPASDWTQCIPGCVDPAPAPPRSVRLSGELRLGGLGMLVRWKGWHLVLDALERMSPRQREQVRFLHAGGPDDSLESRAYAAALQRRTAVGPLASRVVWMGEQTGADRVLADIDVLLVPSVAEPLSIAMLEALRAGVPVVASDRGGPTDVLREGVTGWFFRSGDAGDLARVLGALLDTEALRGVRIDATCIQRFTTPEVAGEWARVYQGLL